MEKVNLIVFVADCGKEYRSKSACVAHEKVCKCFGNPKFKACHTCAFNGGLLKEDGERYRNCTNPLYDYDKMRSYEIPNTRTADCINCPLYKPEKVFTGTFEKWVGYAREINKPAAQIVSLDSLPF